MNNNKLNIVNINDTKNKKSWFWNKSINKTI